MINLGFFLRFFVNRAPDFPTYAHILLRLYREKVSFQLYRYIKMPVNTLHANNAER